MEGGSRPSPRPLTASRFRTFSTAVQMRVGSSIGEKNWNAILIEETKRVIEFLLVLLNMDGDGEIVDVDDEDRTKRWANELLDMLLRWQKIATTVPVCRMKKEPEAQEDFAENKEAEAREVYEENGAPKEFHKENKD